MLTDARAIPDGTELAFDLVVIGSGPAGLTIADRLRSAAFSVCLLESGGIDPELRTQRLYRGSNVGHRYFALDSCRYRLFGGTSNRWGGWCIPLDAIDFERRDWIPGSGWPISRTDLDPFYNMAASLLELATPEFGLSDWTRRVPAPMALGGQDFDHAIVQYSPQTNFADRYGDRVNRASNITTFLHANVTELLLDAGTSRVGAVKVRTFSGHGFTVAARAVVLAAGGLENARLLLASRASRRTGLGNENDLVGRCFMEHIHVSAGHLAPLGGPIPRGFYTRTRYDNAVACGVITPTRQSLEYHRLPSCSIAVEGSAYALIGTPYLGWPPQVTMLPIQAYRRLGRRYPAVARRLREQMERPWMAVRLRQTARYERDARARAAAMLNGAASHGRLVSLYFRAEQFPDPMSRVTLDDKRRDEFGVPLTRLSWRVGETDVSSIIQWLSLLDRALGSAGVGRVVMPANGWDSEIMGGPHHMGTTRMAADPRDGVVDANARVHSVDNLYVAGSSVFATCGYANPTITIVALALRLAEHLRHRLAV